MANGRPGQPVRAEVFFSFDPIALTRLPAVWGVIAILAAGCGRVSDAALTASGFYFRIAIFIGFALIVSAAILVWAAWRDARNRGTYLGVAFGALAEVAIYRRIPHSYHSLVLVVVALGLLCVLIGRVWLVRQSSAQPLLSATQEAAATRPEARDRPRTGLVAYVVTLAVLLALDTVGRG